MLADVPGALGLTQFVLFPLQAELTILAAKLQVLLPLTMRASNMQAQPVRRLFRRLGDLASASDPRRRSPDRFRVDRTVQALVTQECRRAFALDVGVELRQLVVDNLVGDFSR